MRQPLFLGLLDIAQQRASGGGSAGLVIDAEAGQVVQLEERQQLAPAAVGVEQPRWPPPHADAAAQELRPVVFVGHQQLGRFQACDLRFQRVHAVHFVDQKTPAGQIGPGQAVALLAARDRHQQGVAALV